MTSARSTFALAKSLVLADAVSQSALGEALLTSATRGISLVPALLATNAIDVPRLERHLEKGDAPAMRHVTPVLALVDRLPPGICERLLAVPVREDPRTGTVDVAVVDARDGHAVAELSYWLRAPVRAVRTSFVSMDAALRKLQARPEPGIRALAPPMAAPPPPGVMEKKEPGTNPNIPIPLTRKSMEPPLAGSGEPVLSLKRRKQAPAPPPEEASPPTVRGPFPATAASAPAPASAPVPASAPSRTPAPPDTRPTLDALRTAEDRDAIVELLVAGARTVAGRVGVLAVRRDAMVGWACSPEVTDQNTFRRLRVQTTTPTVVGEAVEQGGVWLARLPRDLAHAPLLEAFRSPAEEIAIAGARVEGKPALAIVAVDLRDRALAKKHLGELAAAAGEALARVLRDRRK